MNAEIIFMNQITSSDKHRREVTKTLSSTLQERLFGRKNIVTGIKLHALC